MVSIGKIEAMSMGGNYHRKHHQRIIPPEGIDDFESNKTS